MCRINTEEAGVIKLWLFMGVLFFVIIAIIIIII